MKSPQLLKITQPLTSLEGNGWHLVGIAVTLGGVLAEQEALRVSATLDFLPRF